MELYHFDGEERLYRVLIISSFMTLVFVGCGQKNEERIPFGDNGRISGHFESFDAMPGWRMEEAEAGLVQLKKQCAFKIVSGLERVCDMAQKATDARHFFEANFQPFLLSESGSDDGLMTGYFEPLLEGAPHKRGEYRHPIYARPDDLLKIDLSDAYGDLKTKKMRGRLVGNRIVAYPSRATINAKGLDADVICFVDSDVDRFFLQVQGSGRVRLDSGRTIYVGYADQNGHPYRSIGKKLIADGAIAKENMSLQSIRGYLKQHPEKKKAILEFNPSFIFFEKRQQSATGSLGLELTPMRSLAVDPSCIPLGYLLFFNAMDPVTDKPLRQMALAQDTGGAIKGQVRADLFCGFGKEAEKRAGMMKSSLKMWLLIPMDLSTPSE